MIEKFRRITNNKILMPEVDGLRFLAILPVMLMHANSSINKLLNNNNPKISNLVNELIGTGEAGVLLFFSISGFILALPFLKSIDDKSGVSLKSYFLRRLTRLEPTYIIVMFIMFGTHLILKTVEIDNLLAHFFASLFYCHSIVYGYGSILNPVTWSLEVEIQFYILLPFLIYLISNLNFVSRFIFYLFILFMFPFFINILPLKIYHLNSSILHFIQYFFSGIFVADCYLNLKLRGHLIIIDFLGVLSIFGIFFIEYLGGEKTLMPIALIFSFWAVLKGKVLKSLFSIPIISIIGGMCYTLYLIHYPLFYLFIKIGFYLPFENDIMFSIFNILMLAVLAIFVCSIAFLIIEKPFMDKGWPKKLICIFKNEKL
jgi:peptidoglycan/LPS O-acetylase OafA/YrhL